MNLLRHLLTFAIVAAPLAAADPALLNLVPPATKTIAGLHVDRVANAPIGQFLLGKMKQDDSGFRKFVEATGFDPRRDIREILMAAPVTGKAEGLVLARGIFNGPMIYAAAKTEGKLVSKIYNGVEVLTGKNDDTKWMAILDGSIGLAGDAALVRAALDRRAGGTALEARLAAKVNEYSNQYDAWMVSTEPASQLAASMPNHPGNAMQANGLQAIEQTYAGVKFGTLIQVFGEAVTRSEKDALALADVVRFLAGMAQMNRDKPGAADFAKVIETLQVTTAATSMKLSFSVPQDQFEKIFQPKARVRVAAAR